MELSKDMSNGAYIASNLVWMWEVAAKAGNSNVMYILEREYYCMTYKQLPGGDYCG